MPSEQRTRTLLGILAKENSKTGTYNRTPAQFRETALDTHKTLPAAYYGPSPDLLPTGFTGSKDYLTLLKSQSARTTAGRRRAQSASRSGAPLEPETIEYRSVFKPKPEQEHVCGLAREHRRKVENSEWALLDTLEISLFNQEREWKAKMKAMTAAEQKAFLDGQVREKQRMDDHMATLKAREEELSRKETEVAVMDEQMKEDAKREKNVKLKNERLSNVRGEKLEDARKAKQQAALSKKQEEARILAELKMRLEQEKQAAAVKAEATKKDSITRKLENEAKIQARKEAEAKQKMMDEEMIQAGLRLAEKQERDREEANKAFKAMIEARVKGAGAKALSDNIAKIERENRLIKQFEEQKEMEQRLKEEKEADKRAKQKNDLLQARKDFLLLKEQRATAAREEVAALREEMDFRTRLEKEAEDRKMAGIRNRAIGNKDLLMTQMTDKETRNVEEFVGMSDAERQLNYRLLKQATRIVQSPKQLTSKW